MPPGDGSGTSATRTGPAGEADVDPGRVQRIGEDGVRLGRGHALDAVCSGCIGQVSVSGDVLGRQVHTAVTLPLVPGVAPHTLPSSPTSCTSHLEGSISAAGLPGLARLLEPVAERLFTRGMQHNLGTLDRILRQRWVATHSPVARHS